MSAKLIVFLAIVGATYALVASPKFRRDVESGAPASNSSNPSSGKPSESGAPASNSSDPSSGKPSESEAPASNSSDPSSGKPSESGAPASNSSKVSSGKPSEGGAPASNSSSASSDSGSSSSSSNSTSSNSSSNSTSNASSNSTSNSTSAESAAASAEAAAASAKAAAAAAKAANGASASASSSASSSSTSSSDIQKEVEKLMEAKNHTAILDFGGLPNLKSWLSQVDFTNVTFVAKVPKLPNPRLLPPILGLRERIGLARARLLTRLNGTNDIPTAVQDATIKAIHAVNPTKALSDLAYTILNTYYTLAANCPLRILKTAILAEGVQLVTSMLHGVIRVGVEVSI